ncbi:MAG: MarR family winged helix-turn-helix transcriptional regulator [Wujia sp.]
MCDMESMIQNNMCRYKRLNERKIEKVMHKYNLRKIDLEIMIYLNSCGDKDTARDIAATEMFTKGHISQSIKRMRELGYIEVRQDKDDLRVQHLKLARGARRILDDMKVVRHEIESCVFAGVTEEEKVVLQRILEKIYKNISNEMEELS